jgi:RTX calcium-binding nonapeptide repeat (4 copies)
MGGKFAWIHRRRSDGPRKPLLAAAAVLCLALAVAAGPAVAKKITGSKRSELIAGTKKSDRINGKGGNDLIKGKGGSDRLRGGKGSDKVVGGKGNDKVVGGPEGDTVIGGPRIDRIKGKGGNDLLKAADGRRDSVIDGGSGTNRCIVDTVELSIVRNCGTVQASTPGSGQGPGGGGGGGGPGPGQGLRVLTVDVMCSPAPDLLGCSFHITGDGADEVTVASPVEGGGGVTNVVGVANALSLPSWEALGGYTCTAAGFLRITIGSESVDVPVPCTAGSPPGGDGGGGGPLRATSVDVTCSPAPDVLGCSFHITGDGADAGAGTVEGGGGVTNVFGLALSINAPNWDALGGYTCTSAGSLQVTIGSESVDVPVPCEPSPPPGP